SRKSFPRGASIIAAGDITESLYVVISGRMKVMMSDDEGREVILAILGSNEFFGEMGLIDDHPRSASVVALEACEVLSLSKRDFKKCLAENFEMAMTVMRGLVKRLREADQKIGSLALMDVYGRVARLLLEMAETVNGQKVVTRKLAKQDIAKMIGASREMVSRVMNFPARDHTDHRLRNGPGRALGAAMTGRSADSSACSGFARSRSEGSSSARIPASIRTAARRGAVGVLTQSEPL
ncbi:MAG: cyclic nucleotide-binding domain-containing protein, partial [Betaproteobacteria bacterium]